MNKIVSLLLLIGVVGGGVLFFKNFRVEGLDDVIFHKKDSATDDPNASANLASPEDPPAIKNPAPIIEKRPSVATTKTIAIASLAIRPFTNDLSRNYRAMQILAHVVRRFDVVAVQGFAAKDQTLLPQLVNTINSTGRHFEYIAGPAQGTGSNSRQYLFFFDQATIEVDRRTIYNWPGTRDRMKQRPLVAHFRTRAAKENRAFTFKLINVQIDPKNVESELASVGDVIRYVRDDGDGEDDILVFGDFGVDQKQLQRHARLPNSQTLFSAVPTDLRRTRLLDNVIFPKRATVEFSGRYGVFDMVRELNISIEEVSLLTDRMPVWAEFGTTEGSRLERQARRKAEDQPNNK